MSAVGWPRRGYSSWHKGDDDAAANMSEVCEELLSCRQSSPLREDFPERLDVTWMKHTLSWADAATESVKIDCRLAHTMTLTNDVRYFPPEAQVR
jgi:hypothetical protein